MPFLEHVSITVRETAHHKTLHLPRDLSALPIEFLNEILRYSDLYTVSVSACSTNRCPRIAPMQASLHAPHAVVALTRTKAESHFAVDEVCHALCTPAVMPAANLEHFSISLTASGVVSQIHDNGSIPREDCVWAHQEGACKSSHYGHLAWNLQSFSQAAHNISSAGSEDT